jgi:hypothetical protein
MKSEWSVSTLLEPTVIVSKKTGHNPIMVNCSATCEENAAIEREVAEHIVELHNLSLRK